MNEKSKTIIARINDKSIDLIQKKTGYQRKIDVIFAMYKSNPIDFLLTPVHLHPSINIPAEMPSSASIIIQKIIKPTAFKENGGNIRQ